MNEVVIKRELAEATQRIVKSRDPNMPAVANVLNALGDLLSAWTGETVRVQVTAEGQTEAVDMVKPRTQ
jgi:hypothetical protein